MTPDEELDQLAELIRRVKVEYDMFFGGGSRKAPTDMEWRVQGLLKKHSDTQKLTFQQRFRYNGLAQRYAVYSDLWRQKMKVKEEGYRRAQDQMLGIQGLRSFTAEDSRKKTAAGSSAILTFAGGDESDRIRELYDAMSSAGGERGNRSSLETFIGFLRAKTKEIQARFGCPAVQYTVDVQDGRVRLKARPKP